MSRIAMCAALFLSAALAWGRQTQNPDQIYPGDPSQQQQQSSQPQANPQDKASFNSQIQENIESSISSDPVLSGANVQVSVDDVNISLTGTVQSQGQMARVMALASPYSRYRNVVNKIAVH